MASKICLILTTLCFMCSGSCRSSFICSNRISIENCLSRFFSPRESGVLLLRGGNSDPNEASNQEGLISAVRTGNLAEAEKFLILGACPNLPDTSGMPALLHAALHGHLDLFTKLTESGGDIHIKSGDGSTALHLAAYYGHDEIVRYLLESVGDEKLDPNVKDLDGSTPLHNAAYKGQCACASALLNHGANVNACQDVDGFTALHLASASGHVDMVNLLLREGANSLAIAGEQNLTPQDLAAREECWDVLETFFACEITLALESGAASAVLTEGKPSCACKVEDLALVREAAALVWQERKNCLQ